MSINFKEPMNPETGSLIKKIFEDQIKAMDEKTVLLNKVNIQAENMKEIANKSRQALDLELNPQGDIKTMSDGTKYKMSKDGWLKIE